MKTILVAVLLTIIAVPAMAHGPGYYRGGPHYYHGSNWSWVAPAIIGGAVVYAATRPVYAYFPLPPVVVANTMPLAPLGYHYEQILDAGCNCYRWGLIAN